MGKDYDELHTRFNFASGLGKKENLGVGVSHTSVLILALPFTNV